MPCFTYVCDATLARQSWMDMGSDMKQSCIGVRSIQADIPNISMSNTCDRVQPDAIMKFCAYADVDGGSWFVALVLVVGRGSWQWQWQGKPPYVVDKLRPQKAFNAMAAKRIVSLAYSQNPPRPQRIRLYLDGPQSLPVRHVSWDHTSPCESVLSTDIRMYDPVSSAAVPTVYFTMYSHNTACAHSISLWRE
jgi:hypothetical protein